ncbi:MAG: SAM-dependent methyltransferase, partial [Stellaceae bacterium]
RLVIVEGAPRPVAWAANVWHAPRRISIASIGDAAKQLRAIQRNWALYPTAHHRRAALIVEKLPKVSAKPLRFSDPAPTAPMGSWTLLDADSVLVAPHCSSPFANGEARFVENKMAPSSTYLKLWELFTLVSERPRAGEICLDLGASPGGWSWVLAQLGTQVTAVDKVALAPAVMRLPNVTILQQSAFALAPQTVGAVDWLCCDVICYPARLLALVEKWIEAGTRAALRLHREISGCDRFRDRAPLRADSGRAPAPSPS